MPEETGAKGRITLLRCNGERAKHSRLEKLECSEGSQGKKSMVSQRGGLVCFTSARRDGDGDEGDEVNASLYHNNDQWPSPRVPLSCFTD